MKEFEHYSTTNGHDMAVNMSAIVKGVGLVSTVVPAVIAYLREHPEIWETVKEQVDTLIKRKGNILATISVLHDQVDYLAGSADDEDEARQAQVWAKRLDSCEHAAQLLQAPGASRSEKAALKNHVNELRSEIFTAFIREQGEDAEAEKSA
jgi:lantibiotic modifying enzyme